MFHRLIKYDDCYIELIKEENCSKKELLILEGKEQLKNENCINIRIAGEYIKYINNKLYKQEYYQKNKEEITEKNKKHYEENKDNIKKQSMKYYNENKEQINEKTKEKIKCICGSSCRKGGIREHERSIKHLKFIQIK